MPELQPKNPQFARVVEELILAMPIARFFGIKFLRIESGETEIVMPHRSELDFKPGAIQAGPSVPCSIARVRLRQ